MADKPMPFQVVGAKWLASRRRGVLADVMGLGKTIQAIQACDLVAARRVAIICPAIGRINWRREFKRWSLWGPELYIESFDRLAVSKKARDEFRAFHPDTLIVDEAHYLKNRDAKRTKVVYGQWIKGDGLMLIPQRIWLLTGTPAPNYVTELWTHIRALFPELVPSGDDDGEPMSFIEFANTFADWKPSPNGGITVMGNKPESLPRIREILRKIMLRRRVEDVGLDLPPLVWGEPVLLDIDTAGSGLSALEQTEEVAEWRRVLEAAAAGNTKELYTDEDPIVMATVARLTAELKAKAVGQLIAAELGDGAYDKIVIFARHHSAMDMMQHELIRFNPVRVQGGMTDANRQSAIDRFQGDPAVRVILVQLDAGYHSITLTAATQVAFLELAWTPDINAQAAKRAHRIGQLKPVFVRNFALAGSIDDARQLVLNRKARALLELLEE